MAQVQPGLQLVDVRNPRETQEGVILARRRSAADPHRFARSLDQRRGRRLLRSGYRSLVAASLLRASGFDDVSDLVAATTPGGRRRG